MPSGPVALSLRDLMWQLKSEKRGGEMSERGQGERFWRNGRASGGMPSSLLNVRLHTPPSSQALSDSDLATDPSILKMAGSDWTGASDRHNLASLVVADILLVFLECAGLLVSVCMTFACLFDMCSLTSEAKPTGSTR